MVRNKTNLTFADLTAADLPRIGPWFEDPQTRRWLGGPEWAAETLSLARSQSGRYALLCSEGNRPVSLLDIERYPDGTASFAIVVDPALRRRGIATRALDAMADLPALTGVNALVIGIEHGNFASQAMARRLGFQPLETVSAQGFTDFRLALAQADAPTASDPHCSAISTHTNR